jgi:penicillin amidase/acyl-homoserine-lactone acylase
MRRARLRGCIGLAALALACGPVGGPAGAPQPAYDVRILRDSWGVPHVFGASDADVAFGLAYAHAEDDYATIEGSLLAARGRLASVYGRRGAANDWLVALLRIADAVEAGYERDLAPATRALLEGYAAGINHYGALHPDEVSPGALPVSGRDVVAGFLHKLPLFFGVDRALRELHEGAPAARAEPPAGSNAFAVAPRRSADGRTRLAVNSHQPWEGPVAWYEVHLRSQQGLDVVGGVFPGSPVVLHGHNRQLGWAHTVNSPDLVDVYALELDPADPRRYRVGGEWRELEVRSAPIRVKLLGPLAWTFEREVEQSLFGPVVRGPGAAHAIRYPGASDVRVVEQWYAMNRARDFSEWRAAMAMQALPMFNTVYADREGNIHYVYNARLPLRPDGFDWRGVVPGDTPDTLWSGFLPYERLPQVTNPPSGFVISCNSSPFRATLGPGNPRESDFPASLGIETSMTNRALRALELFGGDESITREEFERYKFDVAYSRDSLAAALVERLLAEPLPDDPVLREAREVLRGWDLRTDADNTGAAIGVLSLRPVVTAMERGERGDAVPVPDLLESFEVAARALHAAHGRIAVPWQQVNRLRRGDVDLGLGGGPDVLHAVYGGELVEGTLTGVAGDSYVLLVEWGDAGVSSRSIHQYGSATRHPGAHFADQAPLFARRELKPVWLDETELRAHLEREYRPGEELRR